MTGSSICRDLEARGFLSSSLEVAVISEEELMDVRALARQGHTYAEIGRLLGRDWRTVKRYLEQGPAGLPPPPRAVEAGSHDAG